jgi:hypothetical protein
LVNLAKHDRNPSVSGIPAHHHDFTGCSPPPETVAPIHL